MYILNSFDPKNGGLSFQPSKNIYNENENEME
jgi:hypothetical protein